MIVTDIAQKGRRELTVWLDGEEAGFLEKRDAVAYGLEIGNEISAELWKRITDECILPRGKKKALLLLQMQDRTTKELHDKLVRSGYTEEQTWEIIAYVVSFRYIDETRYSMNYIRCHATTKSLREMQQTLQNRGISPETFQSAYEQYREEEQIASPEETAARKLVDRRLKGRKVSAAEREKIYGALMRKGFSYEVIRKVLNSLPETADAED